MIKRASQQPRPAKKTVIVGVRMEEELAQRLQELADADERKLSPFIVRILRRYIASIDAKGNSS